MWRWSSSALSALLALCAVGLARADDGWTLLRDEDGVSVFERGDATRELPELRGEVELDAPFAAVLAVIADVPGQVKWMHDCRESRVVKRESELVTLVYNRTWVPWPVSDRDAVLYTEIAPGGGDSATVRFRAVDDAAAPPVPGVVRMPRLDGEFALSALAPARTRVVYRLDIDPGGSLPRWLAARTSRDLPFETLRGLRRESAARAAGAVSSPP